MAGVARLKALAHVDLDAFYSQVEVQRDPSLKGRPLVVVQYNPFGDLRTLRPEDPRTFPDSNGSIIAVSYEARAAGVKRNMMAQQAKGACPELVIVQVPVAHGKADLTIYRDAGAKVMCVLSRLSVCERASIDEAYLDVTQEAQRRMAQPDSPQHVLRVDQPMEGWHLAGHDGGHALRDWWVGAVAHGTPEEQLLAAGATVVAELRAAVQRELGYSSSAGVAHYKVLAKLASALHKPRQQTLVPASTVPALLGPLPIPKLRQLGGKFGEQVMARLGVCTVGELAALPLHRLEGALGGESASWLHRLARGVDDEEVAQRLLPKSCSAGKTFRGAAALSLGSGAAAVEHWLLQLAEELQERLEADRAANQRLPQLLTVAVDACPEAHAHSQAHSGAGQRQQQQQQQQQQQPAAVAGSGATSSSGAGAPSGWRAGVQTSSRSCPMGRITASSIAAAALSLVRRLAADWPPGSRIVSMFLSASNFSPAPTGAATLDRFITRKPQAQPLPDYQQQQDQQQQQQQQQHAPPGAGTHPVPALPRGPTGSDPRRDGSPPARAAAAWAQPDGAGRPTTHGAAARNHKRPRRAADAGLLGFLARSGSAPPTTQPPPQRHQRGAAREGEEPPTPLASAVGHGAAEGAGGGAPAAGSSETRETVSEPRHHRRGDAPAGSSSRGSEGPPAVAAAAPPAPLQMCDLDVAVLAELPYHIQLEIRRELQEAAAGGGGGGSSSRQHTGGGRRGPAASSAGRKQQAAAGRGGGKGRQSAAGGGGASSIAAFFAAAAAAPDPPAPGQP